MVDVFIYQLASQLVKVHNCMTRTPEVLLQYLIKHCMETGARAYQIGPQSVQSLSSTIFSA